MGFFPDQIFTILPNLANYPLKLGYVEKRYMMQRDLDKADWAVGLM